MPNQPPADEGVARVMRQLKCRGYTLNEISDITGYYRYVVRRILRYYKRHGKDRVPQQGRGKRDDVRWVFAGPRKDVALDALELIKSSGDDGDLLQDVWSTFVARGCGSPAYRTLCEALQNHLDYTRKRMGSRARERDVQRSLQWRFRMRITFEPEHFVLVDESAADGRTGTRRMGYSKRGTIAKTNHYFWSRSKRYSVLGPFVIDGGFLDLCIVEGGFDSDRFYIAMEQKVVRAVARSPCLHPTH